MNDDDVVKQVIEDNFMAWFDHPGETELDYAPKQTPFHVMAAPITFNVVAFQNWKRHLADALEVVKNWKAE